MAIASHVGNSHRDLSVLRTLVLVTCMAVFGYAPLVCAAEQQDGDQHGGRLDHVRRLIEDSSAAKRIEASGNEQAMASREKARSVHRQAVAAHTEGKHEQADELLGQATRFMLQAVQFAESNSDTNAKKVRDFDARAESVDALAKAFERICEEKKCDPVEREMVLKNVREQAVEARRLRDSGDIDAGRTRLDEAYVAIKIAVEHQRSGDTLVRSLSFADKEEEYVYELDRNDTHQMLIKLLLEEGGRNKAENLQKFLQDAQALRNRAESEAAAGKYDAAVKSLESSTTELVRALRRAGIYIPG